MTINPTTDTVRQLVARDKALLAIGESISPPATSALLGRRAR